MTTLKTAPCIVCGRYPDDHTDQEHDECYRKYHLNPVINRGVSGEGDS